MEYQDGGPLTNEMEFRILLSAVRRGAIDTSETTSPAAIEFGHLLMRTEAVAFTPERIGTGSALARRLMPHVLSAPFAERWTRVAEALAPVWDRLPWHYHYGERDDAPGLGKHIAFAELAGPSAPLDAPAIRMGFTLMAPDTYYPTHAHPARELYVALSGRALWTKGPLTAWHDPGAVILHTEDEPHAMRTGPAPLLALYTWRGDIATSSRYV